MYVMLVLSIVIESRKSSSIRITSDKKVGNDRNKLHHNTLKNISVIEKYYMINITIDDITEGLVMKYEQYKIYHTIDKFIAYVVLNGLIYYMMLVIYYFILKLIELRIYITLIRQLNYIY